MDVVVCSTAASEHVRRLADPSVQVMTDDRALDPRAIEMLSALNGRVIGGFYLAGAVGLIGSYLTRRAIDARIFVFGFGFIAGSLLWGVVFDGFRPDRYDLGGAAVALVGVAIIMYSPR